MPRNLNIIILTVVFVPVVSAYRVQVLNKLVRTPHTCTKHSPVLHTHTHIHTYTHSYTPTQADTNTQTHTHKQTHRHFVKHTHTHSVHTLQLQYFSNSFVQYIFLLQIEQYINCLKYIININTYKTLGFKLQLQTF